MIFVMLYGCIRMCVFCCHSVLQALCADLAQKRLGKDGGGGGGGVERFYEFEALWVG